MSTINYKQYGLSPTLDLGLGATRSSERDIEFKVTLKAESGKVVLEYYNETTDTDTIVIEQDCFVTITLDGEGFYFSADYAGITTKEELSSYYGSLTYNADSYSKTHERYKSVTFLARANSGGQYGTLHPFNINADLLQKNLENEDKWIALTIDPDITNPPPIDK